jgi:hypothetical protein
MQFNNNSAIRRIWHFIKQNAWISPGASLGRSRATRPGHTINRAKL